MLNNKDYCDYDTCVALKEVGYNEKSNWWFNKFLNEDSGQMELVHICDNPAHLNYDSWGIVPRDFVIRPSLYEAQKWLREDKKIEVGASWDNDEDNWYTYIKQIGFPDWSDTSVSHSCYSSYEEALLEGVKSAIKLLKEEK